MLENKTVQNKVILIILWYINSNYKVQHTDSSDTADTNEIFDGLRFETLKLEVLDLCLFLCLLPPPQSLSSLTTHRLW